MLQAGSASWSAVTACRSSSSAMSAMPQRSPVHCGQACSTHALAKRNWRSGRPRARSAATNLASSFAGGEM
jgi:hypothetical protein